MVSEHLFESREAMFESLDQYCRTLLQQAVAKQGKAGFFVSGGSTPKPLYQSLSIAELPWSSIDVALVDERWVEPDADASNQRFIESSLMQNKAAQARFTVMKNTAETAAEGLAQTQSAYDQIEHWNLMVLGMGNDGHTASIFPHCNGIEAALDSQSKQTLCAIMADKSEVTGDNLERMSLTLCGLMRADQLILLITGEQKLDVYRRALAQDTPYNTPISAVLHQQKVPVAVYWAP